MGLVHGRELLIRSSRSFLVPLLIAALACGGIDGAADAATSVARALVGGDRVDLTWVESWRDRVPLGCPCRSTDSTPLAPACAND